MARYKSRRQARINTLVNKYHFLQAEAVELSRIKKHVPPGGGRSQYPPALLAMQRSRSAMWANYKKWVGKQSWLDLSVPEKKSLWSDRVRKFYSRHRIKADKLVNWIVHKDVHGKPIKPSPSVWDYYDSVFQGLPDELKWDTPRSHRTGQSEVKIDKVQTMRWIDDLKKAIVRTDDRAEKTRFREQIHNLRAGMRR